MSHALQGGMAKNDPLKSINKSKNNYKEQLNIYIYIFKETPLGELE